MPPAVSEQAAFGRAVRQLRKQLGLSQEQLGYAAALHRNYVGGVERGERNPSLTNVYKFARALKIEPPDLLALAESIRQSA